MNEHSKPALLGGVEAGGTKYVCAVATNPAEPLMERRFSTGSDPDVTMQQVTDFFHEAAEAYGPVQAMGIGTFGPADVHPRSPGYGSILTTPKEGWSGFCVVHSLRQKLAAPMPIAFDTDVNAAVLAEAAYGAGRNHRSVAYVTIGTGIGGGFLNEGEVLHGRMHPEIGHMFVPDFDHEFGKNTNVCPFHDSCLEGRASGTAVEARWGVPGDELDENHEAWDLQARYLAAGCVSLTAAWSPEVIILGGGVSQKAGLLDRIRRDFEKMAGDYWKLPSLDLYLAAPELGQQAGIVGALLMAQRLLECEKD